MAVVLFVGLLLLVAACPLPVRRSGALQQHRDQLTRARSLTIPWNAVRRDEERHRNLRLCATLEEIQDDSEPNLFLCTLKSSRNNDVFVQRLHKAVRSKAILDLPYEVRLEVVSEIDFRVNSLTYSSLSECLWCVSQMGLKAEDVAVELANEVARSLTLAAAGGEFGVDTASFVLMLESMAAISQKKRNYWKQLPDEAKKIIATKLIHNVFSDNESLIVRALWSLGRLGFSYHFIDNSFRSSLNEMLASRLWKDRSVSKLLYSLAQLQMQWYNLNAKAQLSLLSGLRDSCVSMNEQEVSNVVYALGKMGVNWFTLSGDVRSALTKEVTKQTKHMPPSAVATTFWALGKCGAKWDRLPKDFKDSLTERLVAISPLQPHSLSVTCVGLAKMRASFLDISSLAPSTVDALLKSIDFLDRDNSESTTSEVDGEFTEQTISSLMWSLGTLRLDFRRLLHRRQIVHTSVLANNTSSSHLEKLMDCVSSVSNQLSLQGVFNVLHGAANMNMMRSTFSSKVWSELEEAIVRTTKEFLGPDTKWSFSADIAVSNIIWSCGKLGATRTSAATQQLLDVFLMRGLAMGHLAVSSSMHGFTKMQIRWSSLSPSAQTSLLEIVTLVLDSCNEQSFSNILWCITEMEIPVLLKSASESATRPFSNSTLLSVDKNLLAELESKLSTNLVRLSNNFTGLGISTILYSLAKNHKYQQLPKEVCTTLEMRLVSFYEGASSYRVAGEVSNIIYALGKLEAKFDLLPVPVQMILSKVVYDTCGKMNEQQIGNVMWGLVGQMKLPFLAIDQKLRVALIKRIVVISKRQKSFRKQALIAILQSLGRGMQVNWYLLPDDLREALLKSSKNLLSHTVQSANNDSHSELVANELDDSNHIDVNSARLAGNIAAALGRLKFRWDDEESKSFVKETLLRKLPADNSTMMKSGQAVATTLNGLARMVKSCTALDQETCDMLNQAVVINVPDMHPAENANALWSLAMMRATLFATNQNICDSAASESLCKSTAKNLVLMTNYELVWSLWSLAQLRTPFEDLPKSLQESILQAISSKVAELSRQELGLTLWSLGVLKAPVNQFPEELIGQLLVGIDELLTRQTNARDKNNKESSTINHLRMS